MNLQMFNLSGHVALVTGGYTGIGRAIAEGLAQAGASIVIAVRKLDRCERACEEIARSGVDTLALRCDIGNAQEVDNMMAAIIKRFGKLDILVNNAGVTGSAKEVVETSDQEWSRTLLVNLTGTFNCSRAAAREMMKRERGKIINVASVGSFKPLPRSGDYSASKGGVLLLTRTMALELIRYNINVNAICPGYFATTKFNPEILERARQHAKKKIPIGRVGEVDEIKGAAVFLASSASDYLVGSEIIIDGGLMLR